MTLVERLKQRPARLAIAAHTDGVNQWYDWPTGLPNNPDADYTAYGRVREGLLGTTKAARRRPKSTTACSPCATP